MIERWIELLKENDYIGIKKYIKDGANIDDVTENEESVLICAIKNRVDFDIVELLIENGADIYDFDNEGVSVFDFAIAYNNIELVKYLIADGIDVNKTTRKSRFTPLMAAVSYGRVDIVKLLLENKASLDAVDSKGLSASDFARKLGKKSILELLI